jgi:hypothetical protein
VVGGNLWRPPSDSPFPIRNSLKKFFIEVDESGFAWQWNGMRVEAGNGVWVAVST